MKALLKHKKLMLFLAIVWTIVIFIGCSLPGKDLPPISIFDHFDKVVHFVFFLIFTLLWSFALGSSSYTFCIGWILISLGYGFALEFYQVHYVAGRSWDVWDGVADGLGALVACPIARKIL